MLKEERIIRREINGLIKYAFKTAPLIADTRKGQFGQMVHELVNAVREDAIRVMRNNCLAEDGEFCDECDRQASAIRRK